MVFTIETAVGVCEGRCRTAVAGYVRLMLAYYGRSSPQCSGGAEVLWGHALADC